LPRAPKHGPASQRARVRPTPAARTFCTSCSASAGNPAGARMLAKPEPSCGATPRTTDRSLAQAYMARTSPSSSNRPARCINSSGAPTRALNAACAAATASRWRPARPAAREWRRWPRGTAQGWSVGIRGGFCAGVVDIGREAYGLLPADPRKIPRLRPEPPPGRCVNPNDSKTYHKTVGDLRICANPVAGAGAHAMIFETLDTFGHEQVVFCHNKDAGLKAIIAIHNTVLGPALGGTRMWPYK